MTRFLLARLAQSVVVLLVISYLSYVLMGLMPGDPIDLLVGADPAVSAADVERLRALQGLDRPIHERYWSWLTAALGGELGHSRLYSTPVLDAVGAALANTALLLLPALAVSVAIALPLGVLAAYRAGTAVDRLVNVLAFVGISLPQFWLGLLLILVFAVVLGWLPAGGIAREGAPAAEHVRYLVLPAATLMLGTVGGYVRYVRAAMIEALRQDYIRSARARGARPARVIWVHALRNALTPFVTILGLDLGLLFSGALVTETVFAWPGMGRLIFEAVIGNDYNLALVALLIATGLILLGNLLADLCHGWLDPRIRAGAAP
ncbi:MAG TPA: ABC transporter permease [Pseudomonadales bacterium]